MDYFDFARKGFSLAVEDADLYDDLFPLMMDLEGALSLSKSSGYHNLGHVLRVGTFGYWTGQFSGLSQVQCNELLVAGLFHDAGHSGNAFTEDRDNVAVAVGILRGWDFESVDMGNVERLVVMTVGDDDKVDRVRSGTQQEQVMVDADYLVWCDRDFEEVLLSGLRDEGVEARSPEQFFGDHGCFTPAAQGLFALHGLRVGIYY